MRLNKELKSARARSDNCHKTSRDVGSQRIARSQPLGKRSIGGFNRKRALHGDCLIGCNECNVLSLLNYRLKPYNPRAHNVLLFIASLTG